MAPTVELYWTCHRPAALRWSVLSCGFGHPGSNAPTIPERLVGGTWPAKPGLSWHGFGMLPVVMSGRFLNLSYVAPVVRRVSLLCVGLSVSAVLAGGIATLALELWRPSAGSLPAYIPLAALQRLPMVLFCLPLVFMAWGNWRLRGVRRSWVESRGRLCPGCGYDVSTLLTPPASTATCPECGGRYEHEAAMRLWESSGFTAPR